MREVKLKSIGKTKDEKFALGESKDIQDIARKITYAENGASV
jgi:hypothetical protein